VSARAWMGLAAVAGGSLTLVVSVGSVVRFATGDPALRVAVETAAALISIVAAQLMYGRFREGYELRDLLLTASLSAFAATNLAFSLPPALAADGDNGFAIWAAAGGRLLGAALMALAAVTADRPLRRPQPAFRRALAGCFAFLGALALVVAVAGDALPRAVDAGLSPDDVDSPRIVGNATILSAQLVITGLFTIAAVGFGRRADRTGDQLAGWLAVAATLGAFAALNYFLFPSLYTSYFYVGDVLRLGFFVALFCGGALELRRSRDVLAAAAVLEERRRIARDIHDGVTQDLAYILQQGRRLAGQPDAPMAIRHMVLAAGRALDESRHAIAALERSGGESLIGALKVTAVETAGREGGSVDFDLDGAADIALPVGSQEVLLRVLREAIINAFRHGRAETVKVTLSEDPGPRLVVSDDGVGFDVKAASGSGRLGLLGMAERVRRIGGELQVESAPGHGTQVEVRLL
jgi:signal transduction histidine kinase